MKNLVRIILLTVVVLGLVIGSFSLGYAAEKNIVIEVAHMFAAGDPSTIAVEAGKKYIEEKTNGRITFKIYTNGTYGEQFNSIQAVRMGTLDVMCSGFGSEFYEPAGAIQGPYLFKDYDQWKKFKVSNICKEIVSNIEKAAGFKIVGIGHFGFRETLCVKPAKTVDDFSKLKLRVVNAPPYPEAAVILGATGTPIPIVETYMSIMTGVVQGTENPVSQIIAMKFYEVAKNLIKTDHMIATQYWVCSNKRWNSLSPDDQKIFAETWDYIANMIEQIVEQKENDNIKLLQQNGVTVITPDKQQFIDRLPLVFKKYPAWKAIYDEVSKL